MLWFCLLFCLLVLLFFVFFFFFNDTATTEIYTLSLHDALPICRSVESDSATPWTAAYQAPPRSEEHTSELQSPWQLVCRLLLEKKKKTGKELGVKSEHGATYELKGRQTR